MLSIYARQSGTDTAANFAGGSNNISAKRKVKVDESSTFAFRKFLSNTVTMTPNHAIENACSNHSSLTQLWKSCFQFLSFVRLFPNDDLPWIWWTNFPAKSLKGNICFRLMSSSLKLKVTCRLRNPCRWCCNSWKNLTSQPGSDKWTQLQRNLIPLNIFV